jgi:two-component system chemotaxis family response regulator WspR
MVLLVDDQVLIGESIRRLLVDDTTIDFHFCSDAEQALATAERIQPMVILQDLVMPGADGVGMVRQYRAHPATTDIPIIVLSTREDPNVKAAAFAAGANDYLVKLPDRIELIARIRCHARAYRNKQQRDEAFQALRESQQQLTEANILLQRLMNMDGLTGLNNRRRFDEYAAVEWSRAVREKNSLSLLMIDVDYFKAYNDTYGHLAGDEVLKQIAQAIQQSTQRPADLAARFGGEEFVLILPATPAAGAQLLGQRIVRAVNEANISHAASPAADHATVSIGGASTLPGLDTSLLALLETADLALYAAKHSGRNRLVMRD